MCGVAESYESSVNSSEEQPHSVQSRETLGENREKSGEKLRVEERENSRLTEVRGIRVQRLLLLTCFLQATNLYCAFWTIL